MQVEHKKKHPKKHFKFVKIEIPKDGLSLKVATLLRQSLTDEYKDIAQRSTQIVPTKH